MVSSPEELFRKAAGRVFNGWTALQLAVEHGMGGSQGHAKAMLMIDAVVDLFKSKPHAEWTEVADLLGDMMDDEFNTVCEDDSTDEVGTLLWEFYKICTTGDNDSIEEEIAKLPSGGLRLSRCIERVPTAQEVDDGDSNSDDGDAGTSAQQGTEGDEMDTQEAEEDPGWTQVTRRKK